MIFNWLSNLTREKPNSIDYNLGLVLSGGGMRGVAHAGFLQVLLDADIVPDVISGASAGSLVGALFAAGYAPAEMKEFFKTGNLLSYKHISLLEAGFLHTESFRSYLEPYFPEDRFDTLKKDLFVLSTNLLTGEGKVFSEGELIKPLLASCAVPGVFAPVKFEKTPYGDGGIYSNFPTEPLEGRCKTLLGVYVHPLEKIGTKDLKNPFDVVSRAYDISRSAAVQAKFPHCDLVVIPKEIEPYGVADQEHVEEMFQAGITAGTRMLSQIQSLIQEND